MNNRTEKRRKSRAVFANPHEDRRRLGYEVRGRVARNSRPTEPLSEGDKLTLPEGYEQFRLPEPGME